MVGARVQNRIAAEFNGRQWLSHDLVGHAFGDVVSIPLAASIMLLFLEHGVLTVAEFDLETPGTQTHCTGPAMHMCIPETPNDTVSDTL